MHAQTKNSKVCCFFLVSESPKRSGLEDEWQTTQKTPCFSPITKSFYFFRGTGYIVQQFVQFPGLMGKETPNKDGWEKPQLYRNSH